MGIAVFASQRRIDRLATWHATALIEQAMWGNGH